MSSSSVLGSAVSLSCRECGEQYPISPRYACEMCFGPLEVAYDYAGVSRESVEAGPRNIWRYRQLLPVPANVTDTPNLEPGLTKLVRADNLARELGMRRLWVKDDSGEPDPLLQGPRRRGRAGCRARAGLLGAGAARRPATSRTRSRRRPRGPASSRSSSSPPTSSGRRSSRPPFTAAPSSPSKETTTTSTGSRRRSPASKRTGRSST